MTDFLKTVLTIIVHTPIWVWPLYALLLFLGFQRTRDSNVPLWRVLILPAVVALLALFGFVGAGPGGLPAILPGLAIGGLAGWQLERDGAGSAANGGRWPRSCLSSSSATSPTPSRPCPQGSTPIRPGT